jgi:hypothetical protein
VIQIDELTVSEVIAAPQKFQRTRLRVKGVCRIEFEGTALYTNREAMNDRTSAEAIWLTVGWPVPSDVQGLDGKEVSIEGTFDLGKKGHDAAYVGSLVDVNLPGVDPAR